MNAHVLLLVNLLNEFRGSYKMQGLQSIYCLLATILINSIKQEHKCYYSCVIMYAMILWTSLSNITNKCKSLVVHQFSYMALNISLHMCDLISRTFQESTLISSTFQACGNPAHV